MKKSKRKQKHERREDACCDPNILKFFCLFGIVGGDEPFSYVSIFISYQQSRDSANFRRKY